jgi:hypothetical protein
MSTLTRQYDIYVGRWRNNGQGLRKLQMTDLETNYSYYKSHEIPMGICFSRGSWFCHPFQTASHEKSLWFLPLREMRIINLGSQDTIDRIIFPDHIPSIQVGQLLNVRFNSSYAFKCVGANNVTHFRAVNLSDEAPDSPPPLHVHNGDPWTETPEGTGAELNAMSHLLLRIQNCGM